MQGDEPRATSPRRRWAGFDAQDLACLGLIAVACLALRLPALDRIALNPDESQYEATASYLVATGRSAFSLTYGVPATMAVYRAAASLFGFAEPRPAPRSLAFDPRLPGGCTGSKRIQPRTRFTSSSTTSISSPN